MNKPQEVQRIIEAMCPDMPKLQRLSLARQWIDLPLSPRQIARLVRAGESPTEVRARLERHRRYATEG